MEWGTAYHWPSTETVDVNYVLKRREEGRYEAGDCWCHENCYNQLPRTGCKLGPRKNSSDGRVAHFWRGTGSYTRDGNCKYERIRKKHNESQRYAQFYHDLRQWLSKEEEHHILSLIEYHESKDSKYSDFLLHHFPTEKVTWEETEILIVHKNRKRYPRTPNFIRIDLSQWTVEQISNFEQYGKRKIIEEFEQLISKIESQRINELMELELKAKEEENKAKEAADSAEIRQKEDLEFELNFSNLKSLIDEALKIYSERIESDRRYTRFVTKAESYIVSSSEFPVWHDMHKEMAIEATQLERKYFDIQITRELRYGRYSEHEIIGLVDALYLPTLVGLDANNNEMDTHIIWKDVCEFLEQNCKCGDDDVVIVGNSSGERYLCEVANRRVSEIENKTRDKLIQLESEIRKVNEINTISFRQKYDYSNEIDMFSDIIKNRMQYFSLWLAQFNLTTSTEFSNRNARVAQSRWVKCRHLLQKKTKDERMYEYHSAGYNTAEQYIQDNVGPDIFDGIEQGHNMLRMPKSSWELLSSDEKKIVRGR